MTVRKFPPPERRHTPTVARRKVSEKDAELTHAEALLTTGALQSAIFNSANFSSIRSAPTLKI